MLCTFTCFSLYFINHSKNYDALKDLDVQSGFRLSNTSGSVALYPVILCVREFTPLFYPNMNGTKDVGFRLNRILIKHLLNTSTTQYL